MSPHLRLRPALRLRPLRTHLLPRFQSTTAIPSHPPPAPTKELTTLQLLLQKLAHAPPPTLSPPQLQLALHSLAHPEAPVRVAIYGPSTPLLRALLNTDTPPTPTTPIILRYAAHTTPPRLSSTLRVVTAPLDPLRTHNTELLLAPHPPADPLAPVFPATPAAGARTLHYPVHRAVHFAGSGPAGLHALLSHPLHAPPDTLLRVLDLPGAPGSTNTVAVVNAADPHSWRAVQRFVFAGTHPGAHAVKPAVVPLLREVLRVAAAAPDSKPVRMRQGDTSETLAAAVVEWVGAAEREVAAATAEVRRATPEWWQLFYRVDDVSAKLRGVLGAGLLVRAEKRWVLLRGRMQGAGVPGVVEVTGTGLAEGRERVRARMEGLHAAAQKVLGRCLLLAGSGGALSGLICASGYGVYEAGSVGAVLATVGVCGLVKRWAVVREEFVKGVAETGRGMVEAEGRALWAVLKRGEEKREEGGSGEEARRRREIEEGLEAFRAIEKALGKE